MNTLVSFELAKLLKEKKFDNIDCNGYYHVCDGYTKGYAFCYSNVNNQSDNGILAPTIAEVVMWLYEKHGIWIGVQPNEPYIDDDWCFTIFKDLKNNNSREGYNSSTEAYEAAIEHTLKNLINERIQI